MRFVARLVAALSLFTLAFGAYAQGMETLRIGLLPGESAPTVVRLNQPLADHLASVLDMEVELVVGSDYAATGEALRFGRIDVAYLGPITYVLQRDRADIEAFAMPYHPGVGTTFQAAIIVRRDSGYDDLGELAGKDVAFGDPASTSGTWVPKHQLLTAGLVEEQGYKAHYLGSHDAVALAVMNGKAAAGGISLPIYERLINENKIDGESLKVLALSQPIPEYSWTFRPGLDDGLKHRLQEAFTSVPDESTLQVFRAEKFVPSQDADYDIVRGWVRDIRDASGRP